jgi:hypothetical protein
LWNRIKIEPKKWQEQEYGEEGNGFWAVAILGKSVIWYNDIEEGFNVSSYDDHGVIAVYWAGQNDLFTLINNLWEFIKTGDDEYNM